MNKRTDKTVFITIITFVLLIFGDMVTNFKIFDVMYILSLMICFVHYQFFKNAD